MKRVFVTLIIILSVLLSGCVVVNVDTDNIESTEKLESTVAGDNVWYEEYIEIAVEKVKEQWMEIYSLDGIKEGVIEIKNTYVAAIAQNDDDQFKHYKFVVKFDLSTQYDITNTNNSNRDCYETVVFDKYDNAWCVKYDPFLMYMLKTESDYLELIEKHEDLGNMCNETFVLDDIPENIPEGTLIEGTLSETVEACIKDTKDNVVISNEDVKSVAVMYDKRNGYFLHVEMNEAGTTKFAKATKENIGKPLAIYVDGVKVMSPYVFEEITNGMLSLAQNSEKEEVFRIFYMLTD